MLPSLCLFLLRVRKKISSVEYIRCFGLFVLGLLPYLYIPLAAAHNPPINWDRASNLENFLHLVTRADYGWSGAGINLTSTGSIIALKNYVWYWLVQLPLIVSVCIPIGILAMLKKKHFTLFFAILLAVALFGPLFIMYSLRTNPSVFFAGIAEKFYIASLLFYLLLFPYAIAYSIELLLWLLSHVSPVFLERHLYKTLFTCFFLVVPFYLFSTNFPRTDLHAIPIGNALGRDILSSLPNNSYLCAARNDNVLFTSRYIQYGYDIRKDVHVLQGCALNSQVDPSTIRLHALPYDDRGNAAILSGVSLYLSTKKPTFLILPYDNDYNGLNQRGKTMLIPYGLLLKVATPQEQNMEKEMFLKQQQTILGSFLGSSMSSSVPLSHLWLIADIPKLYANAYANTGTYLIAHYGDYNKAKDYFDKALTFSLDSDSAYEGLGDYFVYKHECQKAKNAYNTAIQINHIDLSAHQKLYTVVTTCLHDSAEAKRLRDRFLKYPEIFNGI